MVFHYLNQITSNENTESFFTYFKFVAIFHFIFIFYNCNKITICFVGAKYVIYSFMMVAQFSVKLTIKIINE